MKQFAVIGCGRFGSAVAKTLHKRGNDVLAIDEKESALQAISPYVTHSICLDIKDERQLREAGLRNIDIAIVAIGSDIKASIMATLLVKEIGVPYVVAKALDELHAKMLQKTGADRVVFPERDMALRLAHSLISDNILDYIELSPEYSIIEVVAPDKWIGQSLKKINVRSKFGLSILAIKQGDKINVSPDAEVTVHQSDVLVVLGTNTDLQKIQLHKG